MKKQFVIDVQQAAWNNTPMLKLKAPNINIVKEIRKIVMEKRKARRKLQLQLDHHMITGC